MAETSTEFFVLGGLLLTHADSKGLATTNYLSGTNLAMYIDAVFVGKREEGRASFRKANQNFHNQESFLVYRRMNVVAGEAVRWASFRAAKKYLCPLGYGGRYASCLLGLVVGDKKTVAGCIISRILD